MVKGVRGRRRLFSFFENSSVDVGMMSPLPVISHSCDSPTLALHKSFLFLLHFLPHPPPSVGVLSPSLSLSPSVSLATCMPQRSLVVSGLGCSTAGVRVFSGGACSKAGVHRIRRQSTRGRARTCQCTFSVMATEDSAKSINEHRTLF